MSVSVKIDVPEGMYKEIKKLVRKRYYRSFADFFYTAGQKELERRKELLINVDEDRGREELN
jgi:Arc/MetJ-type ribon-helix-helix transcriptional regulator